MRSQATTSLLLTLLLALPVGAADPKEDFWEAARKGDAAAVKAVLDRGVDVNARTAYGATALSFAADKGHLDVVQVLLDHKADVNIKDTFYHQTPLSWAAARGHAAIVKALLAAGAEGADAALAGAAEQGKTEVVRVIVATGKVKEEGLTKALAATPAQHTEIIALLAKAGAKQGPPAPEVKVAAEVLQTYAGVYRGETGSDVTVRVSDGKLTLASGGPPSPLVALDDHTFKLAAGGGLTIAFQRKDGKVSGLSLKRDETDLAYARVEKAEDPKPGPVAGDDKPVVVAVPRNWPSFRGPNASGVADGQQPPTAWDVEKGVNVRWKTPIPGLGHSCPVVWGDRIFLTTAVSGDPKAEFRPGLYGDVDSVNDRTEHTWKVYCVDRRSGKVLWEQTATRGVPRVKRHPKGSQANPTPATDGKHVVAFFASEGLYCYDVDGKLLWKSDLGVLPSGWFYDGGYEWGFGSSPILYRDRVIVQCDVGKGSFLATFNLADGKQLWRTPREEIPSWGTPTLVEGPGRVELVTNATKYARGYDPLTGEELWRLGRQAEITVPTPVYGQGLIFITSGYRPVQPIYAVRPGAHGDISLKAGATANESVAWSTTKGGPYLPTPIVYGEYLYVCSNAGIVTCYEAKTGKQVYRERLGGSGGYSASPVAADGKLYFTGEEDGVRVVKAGPHFELLAVNPLGEVCMATPAISDGMIFLRTQHHLFGIGRPEAPRTPR